MSQPDYYVNDIAHQGAKHKTRGKDSVGGTLAAD